MDRRLTDSVDAIRKERRPIQPGYPETVLVEALAVLVSDFLQALATGSSLDALLLFGRLFEALALLDIGNDAILFAGLGETLESAFKRFVGLNNYADHDFPLVKIQFESPNIFINVRFVKGQERVVLQVLFE